MSGTKAGGMKMKATVLARDPQHFIKLGMKAGKTRSPKKGFGSNRDLAKKVGKIGGAKSTRLGVKNGEGKTSKPDIFEEAIVDKKNYGKPFFRRIGAIGGKVKNPDKGFGGRKDLASKLGRLGGKKTKV